MDHEGDDRRRHGARGPKVIAQEQVEREQDWNDRAADVDRQNRARPIDFDRRQKRHAEKLHHLARHDMLPGKADQRQIDVRAEQGAKKHQHGDAGIETEGGIGAAQQADLNKKQKTNQNREEQTRGADADRKVMHVTQRRRPPEAG